MRGGLVLALLLLGACSREEEPVESAPHATIAVVPKKPRSPNFQTPWQDESQYIVETISADLAEMAYYAKYKQPLAEASFPVDAVEKPARTDDQLAYYVTVRLGSAGDVTCEVPLSAGIWSPAAYRALVQALFDKLQLKVPAEDAVTAAGSLGLLKTLTEPRAEILTKTDQELSEKLVKEFTSPTRHEEAALLLGVFTLREASGKFFQIRAELCRMTAHLAFASGLRNGKGSSAEGSLAEAMLTTLYNNEIRALKQLEAIPDSDDMAVWKRALRMRVTGDYRILGESDSRTLLEQLEWFRAQARSISPDHAWQSLKIRDEWKPMADWYRIVNLHHWPFDQNTATSVELGHVMLEAGFGAEFREAALVYADETGTKLTAANMVEALNAEPARCIIPKNDGTVRIRVIGWGLWAAFLQRHLCHTIESDFYFLNSMWDVPDKARDYRQFMDDRLSGLRLYPFVRRSNSTEEAYYHRAQDDEMQLVHRCPQYVPAEAWNEICYNVSFGPLYIPPPHAFINEWHRHNPPPGSVYDIFPRINHPSLTNQPNSIARIERLQAMAPYDEAIDYELLHIRAGAKPTAAQFEEVHAAMLDFTPWACRQLASIDEKNAAAFEKWTLKAAAVDPTAYHDLASFYAKNKRDDEAAKAYLQWIANETDDVAIANDSSWLIDYFERTGQAENATKLADRAAGAYSRRGLQAKAHLLERRQDYAGAVEYYLKVHERYEAPGLVIGCIMRFKKHSDDPRYDSLLEQLMQQYLPTGLKPFQPANLTSPPVVGVLVHSENLSITWAGLKKGDIIVAERGYQVPDWVGFKVIRDLEVDIPYVLKVWRDSRYVDLKPLPADFRFGIDLIDYRAKNTGQP
jgi:hypothetical protein